MDANLDLLLTVVYCITDDFLPKRPGNARRRVTDAEIITLCVAQAIMGVPSDPRFLALARRQIGHLFPHLPERTAFHKRRLRLSGQIEAVIGEFARRSPGFYDDLVLVDSTPAAAAPPPAAGPRARGAGAAPPGAPPPARILGAPPQPQPPLLRVSPARPVHLGRHPESVGADLPEDRREARVPADARLLRTTRRADAVPDRR